MRGAKRSAFLLSVLILAGAASSQAEVFLRGNGGWLDVKGGKTRGVGDPFDGGGGGSVELGVGLSELLALSAEYGPRYDQPARDIPGNEDVDGGSFRTLYGNILLRLDPIESVTPYVVIGGGQGVFHFDYADTGRIVSARGHVRRLTEDELKSWSVIAGFGFESLLSSHLAWGVKGRWIYNRWQTTSREGVLYAFPTGDAVAVEGTLKLRF